MKTSHVTKIGLKVIKSGNQTAASSQVFLHSSPSYLNTELFLPGEEHFHFNLI